MSDTKINFIGWLLFIASAIGYIISSLRSGDMVALIGSVFFLVACLVFLIPFARRWL